MDKHELVAALKQLASEMGRTPLKSEFVSAAGVSTYGIDKAFGSYTVLVRAAGLDAYQDRAKSRKIDNTVFERDIEEHLDSFEPAVIQTRQAYPTIACISDIHFPFHSQRVLDRFIEYVGDEKPEHVIIAGDAWDRYSHGRFPRSHNVFTPREEEQLSRKMNAELWEKVKHGSPKSKCVQMLGNHDARPLKQVLERYPEAEDWVNEAMRRAFSYEGVQTILDPRQELIVEDIAIHHGHRSQLGAHRDYTLMNCIVGHTHKGGVTYRRIRGQTLFEMNCGLAGDPEAKGLTYTPQRITTWTPGFGTVNRRGPQFIAV